MISSYRWSFAFYSRRNMSWKAFGITIIVLLVWYIVCMVASIVLHKFSMDKYARVAKGASLFHWPIMQLDKLTVHVASADKLRVRAMEGIGNIATNVGTAATAAEKQRGGLFQRRRAVAADDGLIDESQL